MLSYLRKFDRWQKYISFVFMFCILIIFLTIFCEKSDLFSGIGSDGLSISHFSPNLFNHFKNKEYFSEAATRILPMIATHILYNIISIFKPDKITYIMLDGFKLNISENIVYACQLLNVICMCLSLIIFAQILYRKNISFRIFFLSSVLFFINFMFLKQLIFEPVFFDSFYLLYSSLLLLSITNQKIKFQYLLLFFSIFISSLTFILSFILIFSNAKSTFEIKFSRRYILFLFSLFYLSVSFYLYKSPLCTEQLENKTINHFYFLSVVSTLIYLYLIIFILIPEKFSFRLTKKIMPFIVLTLTIFFYKFIVKQFTHNANLEICDGLDETVFNKVLNNIRQVNSRPLGFLTSHFNYFGIIILYIFLCGKSIKYYIQHNQKYIPLILLFIFSSLTSESRYLTTFLPFIIYILFKKYESKDGILDNGLLNKWIIGIIMIYNIIWSGFYLKINPLDTTTYLKIISNESGSDNLFYSPLQKYFKHLGPWTSNESYLWQLSVFFITLFFFIVYIEFYFRKKANNSI